MTLIVGVCAKKRIDIFTPSILFKNTVNFTPKSIFCWHPRYPIKRMVITKIIRNIRKSQQPILKIKWKHCEKATYFDFYSVTSKQVKFFMNNDLLCHKICRFFNLAIFRKLNVLLTLILENEECGFATQNFCHL